jgi:two-component system LytT family response regulator
VVIVDDEPLARRGIRQLLAAHADVEIAGEARNGRDAVRILKTLRPDVVFLDIQMPEFDGFTVLRELEPGHVPLIIFVTAFDTFAVRAFDSHAVDYLVKPVREARFVDALERVRERLRSRQIEVRTPRSEPPRRLVIGTSGADLVVDLAEIEWIEADDYYAAVHARGRRHLVRESLVSLEGRLDSSRFVRVHRSAIVKSEPRPRSANARGSRRGRRPGQRCRGAAQPATPRAGCRGDSALCRRCGRRRESRPAVTVHCSVATAG